MTRKLRSRIDLQRLEDRIVPATYVDFDIINHTGNKGLASSDIHVFVYGQSYPTGSNLVFQVDKATGIASVVANPANGPAPSVTVADLAGKPIGIDTSLAISGGRIYLSNSASAVMVSGGAANGPTPGQFQGYYDFVEFATNAPSPLNLDLTQVDQTGIPLAITVNPPDPDFTGSGFTIDRSTMIADYTKYIKSSSSLSPYLDTLYNDAATKAVYSIVNPSKVISNQLQAVALVGNLTAGTGTAGAWTTTFTITGPGGTAPTNLALRTGMTASGPFLPAGATISAVSTTNTQQVTITSAATANPFVAASGVAANFFNLPATALSTAFDTVIDNFFKTGNTYQVEQNSNGVNTIYTGTVKTVTAPDINGGTSTYTVMAFVNGSEQYNVYYPFFTTNSPFGKVSPFNGLPVPPPPLWWSAAGVNNKFLTQYEPPSEMVFACDGVFADNVFQFPSNANSSNVLGGIENVISAALNRGTAAATQFLTGTIAPTNPVAPFSKTATITLSQGSTATLAVGMHVFSFQDGKMPLTIDKILSATTFTVASPVPITPTLNDLLTVSSFYPAGGTWNAYSNFLHNGTAPVTLDGRAYAFSFDDQGGFSSDLNPPSIPATVTITMVPWTPTGTFAVAADSGAVPLVKTYDDTGAVQLQFSAYDAAFRGGVRVAMGDVNRDGFRDIITGPGPGGGPHVRVFSGVDGAEIMSLFAYDAAFRGGVFVAAGDLDRDGYDDVIIAPGAGGGPHVKAYSGKTGLLIRNYFAYDPTFLGGVTVASGDFDGDSFDDLITGPGPGGGPEIRVINGLDATPIVSFFAFDAALRSGFYVSAGDVNSDGVGDIVVGTGTGATPSQVAVFNLASKQPSAVLTPYASFTGGSRVGVSGGSIVTGPGPGGGPQVKVGNSLSFFAFDTSFHGGVFVAG